MKIKREIYVVRAPAPLRPRKLRSPCFPIRETLDYSADRPCSAKSHGGDDFEKRARLTKSKILSLSGFSVSPCLPTFRGCVLRQYHTHLTFIVHCPLSIVPYYNLYQLSPSGVFRGRPALNAQGVSGFVQGGRSPVPLRKYNGRVMNFLLQYIYRNGRKAHCARLFAASAFRHG